MRRLLAQCAIFFLVTMMLKTGCTVVSLGDLAPPPDEDWSDEKQDSENGKPESEPTDSVETATDKGQESTTVEGSQPTAGEPADSGSQNLTLVIAGGLVLAALVAGLVVRQRKISGAA